MCILRVRSDCDSFAEFLKNTELPVYRSWAKGELKRHRGQALHDDYGLCCDLSPREWTDFPGQVSDAIAFLQTYAGELRRLIGAHRVDAILLDFPVESRLRADTVAQFNYLPPELVRLCAEHNVGIEISHYAVGQEENEDDPIGH